MKEQTDARVGTPRVTDGERGALITLRRRSGRRTSRRNAVRRALASLAKGDPQ
jgi:hypothetical protein